MNKLHFFVTHGVWSMAITVLIVLTGVIALSSLSVEQYPNIAPPSVYVSANYPGADATTIKNAVIMPIEDAVNGVEGVDYIYSTANGNGTADINIVFKQGTNADMACVNVQNRVSKALPNLPAEVQRIGVTTMKNQNSILQISGMRCTNGKFSEGFVSNYVDITLMPRLKRIKGVGNIQLLGNTYSLRLWLKPDVMAMYNITTEDVAQAVGEQNLVSPTGSLEGKSNKIDLEYKGQLKELSEFENIVVKSQPDGSVLHLGDISRVELGSNYYNFFSKIGVKDEEGKTKLCPGVVFQINQAPGANATEVNAEIFKLYEDVKKSMPEGLEFQTLMCCDNFLNASMHTVEETLIIAILLVVLVVYFFLQNGKATVIPALSIIVSMIGTFLIVMIAGFSLNLLTLFALVLAIGIVVDDAVVVVEAVEAKLEGGAKNVAQATSDAMHEVSGAVCSCTLVFMAVFIPVTFMQGTQGTFFTQFGVTMAAAVGLSMINALTMCPAMCAMLLKPKTEDSEGKGLNHYVKIAYNASFTALSAKYNKAIHVWIKRPVLSFIIIAVAAAGMAFLMMNSQEDFVPEEDQGMCFIDVAMGPGASFNETKLAMDKMEKIIQSIPEVSTYSRTVGWGIASGMAQNFGTFVVKLKDWEERDAFSGLTLIGSTLPERLAQEVPEATVSCFQSPQIPGYGNGSFMDCYLQDRTGGDDMATFNALTQEFLQKLQQNPAVMFASTAYSRDYPKIGVDIDAAQCKRMGVSPATVLSTLGTNLSGSIVGNYTQYGKVYYVKAQADKKYREDKADISNIYVRAGNGKMVPITQFVKLKERLSSSTEKRMNLYSAIEISTMPAAGYSKADVRKAIEETFNLVFPQGYSYEYAGMDREEVQTAESNMTGLIYCIIILLVYLILACLYNSLWIPFSVLLAIPAGLFGAYLFAKPLEWTLGNGNNIYMQTGVIMIMGLVAKTAILITEYAVQHHAKGETAFEAAFSAAKERLRPIMMTVMAMILGMVPLALETGAGARGNMSLAFCVIGGMCIGSVCLLFVTPAFYIVFQNIHDKLKK